MPYEVELENGLFIQVPNLEADGSNWNTYHIYLLSAASVEGFTTLYDGTETPPDLATANDDKRRAWAQRNTEARCLIITTIPDSILFNFYTMKTAYEAFTQVEILFGSPTTTTTMTISTRVGTRQEVGREGQKASMRAGGHKTAVRRPGTETTAKATDGVSLAANASSQKDNSDDTEVRRTSVVPQKPQSVSRGAHDETSDAAKPNATSTGPTRLEDESCDPPDQLPSTTHSHQSCHLFTLLM